MLFSAEVCMALSPSVRKDRNYVKLIRDYDQRRAVADSDADSEQSLAHVSPTGPATPTQPTPSCASRVYNLNNCSVQIGNDNSQTVHNGQSAESDSRAAATYNPESTDSEADESEASNDEDVVIEVEDGPLTQSANESVSLQTDAAMSPETLGVQLRRSSVRDVNSDDTEPKQIEPGTSYQRSSDSYQNEQLPSAVSIDQPRSSTGNHSGLQNSGAGTEDINESMTAVKALFEPSVPSYLDDQDTEGVDALGGHDSADRMYSAPEDGVSVSCSNPAGRQSASAPCSATAAGNATGSSDVPVDERTGSEYSSPASVRFTNGVGNSSEELNNQPASSGQNESVPNGIMPQQLTIKEAALTLLTVILGVW
jgi:hypothetical protein